MNQKRIGYTVLALSVVLLGIFIVAANSLSTQSEQLGCFENDNCQPIATSFSYVNIGFGFFGFILALGFYMVFFNKGEEALVKRLEKHDKVVLDKEKFAILLQGLDQFEREVVEKVREQDGITQNTLRLRVDMSKAKLSQILSSLEKKGLVKRIPHNKTLAVHFVPNF